LRGHDRECEERGVDLVGPGPDASGLGARNKKQSYLAAQFRRIAGRQGDKRAAIAVAQSILVATYFIVRDGVEYRDLGPDHFHRLTPDKVVRDLVKRLEKLGHRVTLEKIAA